MPGIFGCVALGVVRETCLLNYISPSCVLGRWGGSVRGYCFYTASSRSIALGLLS